MKIEPFRVEIWMNEWETKCDLNLAETCVESLTIAELLDLTGQNATDLSALLPLKMTYGAIDGSMRLREAISALYDKQAPDNVIVTHGTIGANMLIHRSLVDRRDRVVSVVPTYQQHYSIPESIGADVHLLHLREENGWLPDLDLLRQLVVPGTKMIALTNPNNPTGTMMSREALSNLMAAADSAGIRFISDEIYHGLDYAFPAVTAAELSPNALVINSFSKYFCMTGWRVGWMVVPEVLVRPIERLQQNLSISVPTLSQIAAEAAFEGRAEMEAIKRGYQENRRILIEGLPKAGLTKFLPADGAFYLYADVSDFTSDSFAFASEMLEKAHVAATPGVDFDPIHGRAFIRFSYARSAAEMQEAVARIAHWLK